jgi:2-polyprenyl-6-methoxyphenol hydroxylase-like FAD-dependent oxidoreductase
VAGVWHASTAQIIQLPLSLCREHFMRVNGKIIIVGTGVGGVTLAAALSKRGVDVEVYEKFDVLSPAGFGLSVNANASKALSLLGLDAINELGQPYSTFEFAKPDGRRIAEVPIARVAHALRSPSFAIGRDELQKGFLKFIDPARIHTGHELSHYENTPNGVRVFFKNGHVAEGVMLVGADGIHSATRAQMCPGSGAIASNYVAWLANANISDARRKPGYNIHFWGQGARFGLHDIGGGRTYWWGTKNMRVVPSDKSTVKLSDRKPGRTTRQDLLSAYQGWREDIHQIIQATPDDKILEIYFAQIKPLKKWSDGHVTLLGDAAHAMMPSLGQGACMAIEDTYELVEALREHDSVRSALAQYEQRRRPLTKKFQELSNRLCFVEQLNNPLGTLIRNFTFSVLPQSFYFKQQLEVGQFPRPAV